MKINHWLTPTLLFTILAISLPGQNFFSTSDLTFPPPIVENLKVSLVSEENAVVPGSTFWIAAKFEIADEWHIYWKNPGAVGGPVSLDWELPEGFSAGEIHYPTPKDYFEDGVMSHTYEGTVHLMIPIVVPEKLQDNEVTIKAKGIWFVCRKGECQRKKETLELTLPVAAESEKNVEVTEAFVKTRNALPKDGEKLEAKASYDEQSLLLEFKDEAATMTSKAVNSEQAEVPKLDLGLLLMAFIGGAILNLMPCVFPVIGIKIMGFVNQAGEDKKTIIMHGLVYTLGVLLSFWLLAGMLQILRQGGAELGWGFQLQDPRFVFGLTILLLIFALNLSGLFEIGTTLMGTGNNLSSKGGMKGSFFSGVLATVVSTPCAAPFLAPALGAALSLSAVSSFLLFTIMALGLSSPYLLLSAMPSLVKKLPKPGPWMETFKQLMAFPLYGTVMYLLWILAGQIEDSLFLNVLFTMVLVALAGWVYGRWFSQNWSKVVAGLLLVAGCAWAFPDAPLKPQPLPPQYQHLYFFPEPALADTFYEQSLPEKQEFATLTGGRSYVKLPLNEGGEKNLIEGKGFLNGILVLDDGNHKRSLQIKAPLLKVQSTGASLAKAKQSTVSKIIWKEWAPEIQEQLLSEGKILFIDFTARWCATCQSNKRLAFSSKEIAQKFQDAGIVTLKADWTNDDPAITRELAKYGRGAVPFNVFVLPNGKDAIELPEVLTEGIVSKAIEEAKKKMVEGTTKQEEQSSN